MSENNASSDYESRDFVGNLLMNMDKVKGAIRPWTSKTGEVRYYVDPSFALKVYREAHHFHRFSYYDPVEGASPGRVTDIIEGNIIPKTKAFIDESGRVHIYGYALGGVGRQMGIPEQIEGALNWLYGYCTEEERKERAKTHIGLEGGEAKVGDIVEIIKGRKEVGMVFEVAKKTVYSFSPYRDPSMYLWNAQGFKVNADNCKIVDVGYSY